MPRSGRVGVVAPRRGVGGACACFSNFVASAPRGTGLVLLSSHGLTIPFGLCAWAWPDMCHAAGAVAAACGPSVNALARAFAKRVRTRCAAPPRSNRRSSFSTPWDGGSHAPLRCARRAASDRSSAPARRVLPCRLVPLLPSLASPGKPTPDCGMRGRSDAPPGRPRPPARRPAQAAAALLGCAAAGARKASEKATTRATTRSKTLLVKIATGGVAAAMQPVVRPVKPRADKAVRSARRPRHRL
jgi:hypothetical protein